MLVRSLRSSFIDSFSSAKKRCNTSQGFGAFFGQSCDRDRFLFPFISDFLSLFFLCLDFIAISDCIFDNKNNDSTRVCWISNNYNYFGAMRFVWLSITSSAPSLYANLRVPTRVYEKKKLLSCLLNLNKPIFKSSNARGVAFELIGALVRPKDALEPTKQDGIVYKIPCECGKVYIRETGRAMQDRIKEHDRDIRLARTQTSAVSEHANKTGHLPIWKEVKFIDRDPHWYTRYPYKSSS